MSQALSALHRGTGSARLITLTAHGVIHAPNEPSAVNPPGNSHLPGGEGQRSHVDVTVVTATPVLHRPRNLPAAPRRTTRAISPGGLSLCGGHSGGAGVCAVGVGGGVGVGLSVGVSWSVG